MTKQIVAAVTAALALVSASAGFAQMSVKPMMHKPMPKMGHSMSAAKGVYVCKMCKAYYSPMNAQKMGYKDQMGHKLTKMSKAPAGFMDGSKMKM